MAIPTRRAVVSLTLFASICLAAPFARAADAVGVIASLTGEATAQRSDGQRSLARGDSVATGDLLQTGSSSRLTLQLGKRTVINLGPSTSLRVEDYLADAGGEFELTAGRMFYQNTRPANAAPDKTTVRSPYGLLAVRGTRFFAGPAAGIFGVFVADGRVDVTAAGHTVEVTPGLGTDIARPGTRPTRPSAWKPERIEEALRATTGQDQP